MKELEIDIDPRMELKFDSYPSHIKVKLMVLRQLIFEVAEGIDHITKIEETLKWGEPSYLVKKGSTIRIDWKEKNPDQYAIYFKCTSKLVLTFKEIFGDLFKYENNRALIFGLNDKLPIDEISLCIKAALTYHHVKDKNKLNINY